MSTGGRQDWLGFMQGGGHISAFTKTEARCVKVIRQHVGRDNAIPAVECAAAMFGEPTHAQDLRDLRYLINHLIITHNQAILCMAGSGGGYYLPASPAEVADFYHAFHRRAMTGLVKASRGRKASFIDTIEQLTLWYDEPEGEDIIARLTPEREADPVPAWVQLVTRHLERLSADPQRYADEIAALQDKFGEIFVRRETLAKIRSTAEQLQTLLQQVA